MRGGRKKETVVAASGYFNPLHLGHIMYLEAAKRLGTKLVVIVNNDKQVKLKGSFPFMNEKERAAIVADLKPVDEVVIAIDEDMTVSKTLEMIKPDIFANGGDVTEENFREREVCERIGCKPLFGVGGAKIQSSSRLIQNCRR